MHPFEVRSSVALLTSNYSVLVGSLSQSSVNRPQAHLVHFTFAAYPKP